MIISDKHQTMGHYIFKREQTLNSDIETIWSFVSKPENLEKITPDNMQFSILSKSNLEMEEGMLIAYKISPFLNIKTTWISTSLEPIGDPFIVR